MGFAPGADGGLLRPASLDLSTCRRADLVRGRNQVIAEGAEPRRHLGSGERIGIVACPAEGDERRGCASPARRAST
jgi:hypothetical protein